jgi:hypothetical protein
MQRNENHPEPPASNASSMPTWDERIFALLPSGVDPTLIAENLRLSPSQRLDKLMSVLRFVEEASRQRRDSIR